MLSSVREIQENELDTVLSWAKSEGWDIGLYDGSTYFQLSSRNFLVLIINQQLAGVILLTRFNSAFIFIGLYIINEPYRGQGYGKQLWNAAIERLGCYSSINLYAVPQQLPFYRKLGLVDRYINKRYYWHGNNDHSLNTYNDIELFTNVTYLLRYDQKTCGLEREEFLRLLLKQTEAFSIVACEKSSFQNKECSIKQGYSILPVLGDGDCGYSALGITRSDAFSSLSNNISKVSEILKRSVKEALLCEEFYQHLCIMNIFDNNTSHESIICDDEILTRCALQENIQRAYIYYDIIDKRIDAGWAHPAVLQAIMSIQNTELRIWQIGDREELVPLHRGRENYDAYIPEFPRQRIDLVFVNNSHFNVIELHGYNDKIPETGISPIDFLPQRKVCGYGVIRRCLQSYRIGPLYSDTFECAQAITQKLLSQIPAGKRAMFDIPSTNRWIDQYISFFKLTPESSGDTHLLYKGEERSLAEEKCFGIASLELG